MDENAERLSLRVAALIDNERRRRGLSLESLAEAAGLHRTSVGLAVRGKRGLTLESASALAGALGMRLSDLLLQCETQALDA